MRRSIVLLTCTAIVLSLGGSSDAFGADWAMPLDGASIGTPFGESCVSGIHRGVDLAAPVSSPVHAPVAGRILFAGPVPADGGGTCLAATIEIAEGMRVSMLPLETLHVSAGDTVCRGEVVGRLALTGDDSMSVPHLHVGLREGEVYRDPAPMLPVRVASGGGSASSGQPAGVVTPDVPSSPAPTAEDGASAGLSSGGPAVIVMGDQAASVGADVAVAVPSSLRAASPSSAGVPVSASTGYAVAGAGESTSPGARLIEDAGLRTAPSAPPVVRRAYAGVTSSGSSMRTAGVPAFPSTASTAGGCVLALAAVLLARSRTFARA